MEQLRAGDRAPLKVLLKILLRVALNVPPQSLPDLAEVPVCLQDTGPSSQSHPGPRSRPPDDLLPTAGHKHKVHISGSVGEGKKKTKTVLI